MKSLTEFSAEKVSNMADVQNSSGDSPQDLGGLQIPSVGNQNQGSAAPNADLSASAEHVRQRKQRSDAGKPRGPRKGDSRSSLPQLSPNQFAALYSPQLWENTLCAPADAMAAITGKKRWEIAQKEREALGVSGSIAAQCFAVSDPRWLALAICGITILEVYGGRLALELADRKREAAEKKKREGEAGGLRAV